MRRLTHHDAPRNEHGAVAVITAVFMAAIVIPALLVTVDVGRLFAERRQLQNGADAAVLAVAQSCATEGGCDPSFAETYADPNANDSTQHVLETCGTVDGLPGCAAPSGGELTNCLPLPSDAPTYVQVKTRVDSPEGLVLTPLFGADPVAIEACARAGVGHPRTASGIAFTISSCEWENSTGGGTSYGSENQIDISLTGRARDGECAETPPGDSWGDAEGSFGWLAHDENCQATVDTEGTYEGDTGADFPQACRDVVKAMVDSGEPIFLPIYDGVRRSGGTTEYHFKGWAAFILVGFQLPGGPYGEGCMELRNFCMSGYFTEALITDPDAVIGGDDFGVSIVGLTG